MTLILCLNFEAKIEKLTYTSTIINMILKLIITLIYLINFNIKILF